MNYPPGLMAVEHGGKPKEIMTVAQTKAKEWYTIKCTADSGAVDTVGPEHIARNTTTVPNNAPRTGVHYVAANGTPIYNQGEKRTVGKAELE